MTTTVRRALPVPASGVMAAVIPVGDRARDCVAPYQSDRVFDISLTGRCIPAGRAGQPIAGDFYAAYALDRHRLLITVGDAAGHGSGAESRMRQLRTAARRLARPTSSPAELLSALDEIHGRGGYGDDIATMWTGIYDSDTNMLCYSSAGHPPPIIAEIGEAPRLLAGAVAPPLGTGAVAAHVRVDEVFWQRGAALVAYSDGLVERPGRDLEEQLHRLRELVGRTHAASATGATTPHSVAEVLVNALVPDPASARDDVCILVLRRDGTPPR